MFLNTTVRKIELDIRLLDDVLWVSRLREDMKSSIHPTPQYNNIFYWFKIPYFIFIIDNFPPHPSAVHPPPSPE